MLVECPCGVAFFVTRKWLKEHPQGIWNCQGMTTKDGKHELCKRQYTAVTLEKESWREVWNPLTTNGETNGQK